MKRGRVTRRVIPHLTGIVLSLSACADKNYVYHGPYYDRWNYDRWRFWDGCCGFGDRFDHHGWHDGFVRPAGFAGHDGWHGGWGHGLTGNGGFGEHGGFGGHGRGT